MIVRIAGGAFAVAVIAVAAWLLLAPGSDDGVSASAPGEYLYLDNDRVRAYLGQIEGGLSSVAVQGVVGLV